MAVKLTLKRAPSQGSLSNLSKPVRVGFVGISLGQDNPVSNYPTVLATSDGTTDTLSGLTIKSISKVALATNDNLNIFAQNKDYSFTSPNIIVWLNNPLTAPELEGSVINSGGSGLGTVAHNYKVVALDQNGERSLPSNQITLQGISGVDSHQLDWVKTPFATAYELWDSTANTFVRISSGNTVSYTRTSNSDGTVGTIPIVNKARRVPKYDSTYYVDYIVTSYNTAVKDYTSLTDVQNDHGIGSDITNMARLGFKLVNIPEMYICASDGTTNAAFQTAIDGLRAIKDVNYIFALKDSGTIEQYVVNSVINDSQDNVGKERFGDVAPSNTITAVGDANTPGTIGYWLVSWGNDTDHRHSIFPVINGNQVYLQEWQELDGSFTENKLVPNHFLAGIVAFMQANAEDVATSITGKPVPGINFGPNNPPWSDDVVKDRITDEWGGLYIYNDNGVPTVYQDTTNALTQLEDQLRVVVSAEDELRRRIRTAHKQYEGKKTLSAFLQAIHNKTRQVLEDMVADQLIVAFDDSSITVVQDAVKLNKVNVTFNYTPVYEIDEIAFTYGFQLPQGIGQ